MLTIAVVLVAYVLGIVMPFASVLLAFCVPITNYLQAIKLLAVVKTSLE